MASPAESKRLEKEKKLMEAVETVLKYHIPEED